MTAAQDRTLLAFERNLLARCVALVDRRADAALERARGLATTVEHGGRKIVVLEPEAAVALGTARFLASDLAPAIAALMPPDDAVAASGTPTSSEVRR